LRTARACTICRIQKTKCVGGQPCSRCSRLKLHCDFAVAAHPETPVTLPDDRPDIANPDEPPHKRSRRSDASVRRGGTAPQLPQASGRDQNLAQGGTLSRQLVDAYFEQQDSAGRIFLHRASVLTALHENRLDPLLHKAICAFGALVIGDTDLGILSIRLSLEVEQSILSNLYTCTLPRLQALTVLLHLLRAKSSREALWMLLPIAARMAFTLRLNQEHVKDSLCERESRRRLMWSIHLLDTIISAGVDSLAVCPSNQIALRLPSNEYYFSLGMEAKTGYMLAATSGSPESDMGELSYVVRLMSIRRDILRYVRSSSGVKLRSR